MAATRNRTQPDLPARVGAFVAARAAAGERLVVGLSGGCDSVVLADILSGQGLAGRLSAVHVHHGLSPHADRWAAFCEQLCRSLNIPLIVRHVEVVEDGFGLEAAARRARYAAFAGVPAECLLLAQHRGDQAETLLLNLLRGCGVRGAAAMPEERACGQLRLLRPMLGETRSTIEAYARARGLSWVNDESNDDTALTRNYLRHKVMPVIQHCFPAAEGALAQATGNFAEAVELLDELGAMDWQRVADGDAARLDEMRALSPVRMKNLLRYRLCVLGWQAPVATRFNEFVRQLRSAGADRHPELRLAEGRMRAAKGRLHWLANP